MARAAPDADAIPTTTEAAAVTASVPSTSPGCRLIVGLVRGGVVLWLSRQVLLSLGWRCMRKVYAGHASPAIRSPDDLRARSGGSTRDGQDHPANPPFGHPAARDTEDENDCGAGPSSYESLAWVGQALDRAGGQAILVIPQGTRRINGDPEYLDWGPGHNWATALADELPAYIDTHFRTIASRDGRALVGVSAGGYGASNLGLHHPQTFSVVESWSGYFEPTDPTGEAALDLGSPAANAAARVHALVRTLTTQFRRYPTFLAFYVGRQDARFAEDNRELDTELTRAGVSHVFAAYPGGHSTALWKAHAYAWLAMALRHLHPARAD